ncbi:Gfo/Idh/MocA family oxidoreductase [Hydrogenophaga sp. PAMC20947]|uniref:Gfo/Idh/MocA family protein n=1 Tax=Hydrogenophaga sp. PAMC20947 TaxID=2565558 RepID=UPI00109DDBD6|nr:Gfo/Idh/MocA family oxidoreductase [Hydrogenophaga sp. PAMC20947]QCB46413.1 Gfo/Idh/MocA family oxidoreductase [Hydrogenophaga sp. PAMC20947]
MKFGILGWGKIARTQLAPAILEAGHEIAVVGSREPGAEQIPGLPGVRWRSYEAVLADSEVDAVYIALPNHLHVPWTLRALEARKHVLCEKPMALTVAEVDAVQAAAEQSQRHMQEAFMVRHHPQWHMLRDLPLGALRSVQIGFSYDNRDPANIRNRADLGGGALWDIGCYAVFAGIWLFGREPDHVRLRATNHAQWGTDVHAHGELGWGGDACLQFYVSTQSAAHQGVRVLGERGWAELAVPFNAPARVSVRQCMDGGTSDKATAHELAPVNQYVEMVRAFASTAQEGTATDLSESRAVAQTLVRLRHSAGL